MALLDKHDSYMRSLRKAVKKEVNTASILEMVSNPPEGCDPAQDFAFEGWSALGDKKDGNLFIWAVINHEYETALALLDTGKFSPESRRAVNGKPSRNALHIIAYSNRWADEGTIAKLIVDGVPLNQQDCSGDTPLIRAARNNNEKFYHAVKDMNIDLSIKNDSGADALFFYAGERKVEICRDMLDRGVNPQSAYDAAIKSNYETRRRNVPQVLDHLLGKKKELKTELKTGWSHLSDHMVAHRQILDDGTQYVTQFNMQSRKFNIVQSMFISSGEEMVSATPLQDFAQLGDEKMLKQAQEFWSPLTQQTINKKNV